MELQASVLGTTVSKEPSERELVERAKHDRHAFARLYRTHYAAIAGYIGRRVGDPHVAEDLVAEVFVAALRTLPRYRDRGVPVRAWFYRIASNMVSRWARRNRRMLQQALDAGIAAAQESEAPERTAEAQWARKALLSLTPKYQTVLALHYLEGMPLEQVAQATGCRLGTVKSRMARGRQALREQLKRRR